MLYSLFLGFVALSHVLSALKRFESDNFILIDSERSGIRWSRGNAYCRSRYRTGLATVDSAEKQAEMAKLMSDNGYTTDKHKAWLGATDAKNEGEWRWRDGEAMDYSNWNVNEPNGNSRENCLMTWPHASYRWNDGVCSSRSICKLFICDKPDPHVKGEHYTYVRTPMSWREANKYCKEKFDSELAAVMNGPQSDHLAHVVYRHARGRSNSNVWIGLDGNDNPGNWRWADRSKICYGNWATGEGDGNPELGCGALYRGQWYRRACKAEYPFVCNNGDGDDDDDDDDDEDCDCDGKGNPCSEQKWAVQKGGYYWAWASPCSGGCSQAELKYGWRYATEEEWKSVPTKEEFYRDLPESEWCAAKIFDPKYDHCDEVNKLVRVPDGSYNEQVLIHAGCGCDCDGQGNSCDVPSWSIKKAGLYWAWASPCSGGCSQAELKNGWRYATPEEWKNLPSKQEFFRNLPESQWCAASFFDPKYNHCDENNDLVRVPDGKLNEQVLVHDDDCDGAPTPPPPPPPADCDCDGKGNDCDGLNWAVEKGGLYWAWASPCSGGCSQAELKYGWRYATEEEWQHVPSKEEFYRDLPESEWCAAKIFDPKYNHCDQSNPLVRVPNGGYYEQVLVRSKCDAACKCAKDKSCKDTGYAHYDAKTKLYWAWASPCSGGCSKLKNPIPFGWRRATATEWAAKGFNCDEAGLKFFGYDLAWDHGADGQQIKSADYPDTCASNVFDEKYEHCDAVNFKDGKCTYKEEGSYFETLIVHDSDPAKCAEQQNDALWDIFISDYKEGQGDTMITVGEDDYAYVRADVKPRTDGS